MFAGTFKTDPYSIGHAYPLRIMSPTFEATLRDQKHKKWSQFSYKSDEKLHVILYISILLTLLPSFGFISFKTRLVRGLAMSISLNFLRSVSPPPLSLYVYLWHRWLTGNRIGLPLAVTSGSLPSSGTMTQPNN